MKDREEIVSAFKQCGLPGACLKCKYGAEREGCYAALRHDVLELLKKQPEQKFFVDSDGKMTPLPIQKHGHWIVHGGRIKKNVDNRIVECTVCNNFLSMSGVNGGRGNANYCPNCGAKMDGKVEQDG